MTSFKHDVSGNYSGVHVAFHIHYYNMSPSYQDSHGKRYDHYNGHFNKLVDNLKDLDDKNIGTDCIYSWSKGDNASTAELTKMVAVAQTLSPDEIQQAADKGLISSDEANALIVIGGLQCAGYTGSDMQLAMKNYQSLSDEQQASVVKTMSARDVKHTVNECRTYGTDNYHYEDIPGPLNSEQVRTAIFLANADTDQLDNLDQFVAFDYDDTQYDCVHSLKSIDNWDDLGYAQLHDLEKLVDALPTADQAATVAVASADGSSTNDVDVSGLDIPNNDTAVRAYLAQNVDGWNGLAADEQGLVVQDVMDKMNQDVSLDENGNYVRPAPNGDGKVETVVVGKPMTPEDLRGKGLTKDQIVDIGTLMFLVLMDRMESQDELIRGYTADVDAKNQDLKNATAAQAALRACDADDGTVDTSEVYFTDQSGNEVSIYDYCEAYGIEMPEDGNGNPKQQLDKTDLDNLLTSMKSYSDTLSTDAQSALQKLQQATDRYSNTNSLLTNFESSWRGMLKEVIGNLRT